MSAAAGPAADTADDFKTQGNEHFKNRRYVEAIQAYSEAIALDPKVSVYFSNRAACHLQLENYGLAIADAGEAIELDASNAKAFFRRGEALLSLGKVDQALPDFRKSATLAPRDAQSRARLKQCTLAVRESKIREAIQCENLKPLSETLDWREIPLDAASYDGPVWEDEASLSLEILQAMIQHFKAQKMIAKRHAYRLILETVSFLKAQPNVMELEVPAENHFTVCGDVHGQFFDVLALFEQNGFPSEQQPYLFNGDVVDRGSFGLECILMFFGLKLLLPGHFFFTRGNHETKSMNSQFGFQGEVVHKLDHRAYELLSETFNWFPLAALIDQQVLVLHGGLFSQDGVTVDDIRKLHRVRQPPDTGIMAELLWSDPKPTPGRSPSDRGIAVQFGPDVTQRFLEQNKLKLVIRSHQVKERGFEVEHTRRTEDGQVQPMLATVFSAPNYQGLGNAAAVIRLKKDLVPQFVQIEAARDAPNVPPMRYQPSFM